MLVPLAAYLVATLADGALLPDGLAALLLLGIALVGWSGAAMPALAAALLSFGLHRHHRSPTEAWSQGFTWGDSLVLLAFIGCAAVVAALAAGPRRQIALLVVQHAQGTARRELGTLLAGQEDEAGVARAALKFLEKALKGRVVLWVGEAAFHSGADQEPPRPPATLEARGDDGTWVWIPLEGADARLGALGLLRDPARTRDDDELAHLLGADIAHSVTRARRTDQLQRRRVANESERLCTALLASVSHDLRTPLTTIMGAAETLRTFGETLPPSDRTALLSTIEAEGNRLDLYIQNLVDVTSIGDGVLAMDVDPTTVGELVASAAARLRRYERDVRLDVRIDRGVPPVRVNGPLIEQALFNVLHNAAKFSPDAATIVVEASADPDGNVLIDVVDRGPGIPEPERERVFDMFYSACRGNPERAGTGLGLAISKSILRAHGGAISAHEGQGGMGTRVRLAVPHGLESRG